MHVSLDPAWQPNPRFEDPVFRLEFARLVTHYWAAAGFLADGQLQRDVGRLADIPAVLIAGRQDVSGPVDIAWQLHGAWPRSELVIVEQGGHGTGSGEALQYTSPCETVPRSWRSGSQPRDSVPSWCRLTQPLQYAISPARFDGPNPRWGYVPDPGRRRTGLGHREWSPQFSRWTKRPPTYRLTGHLSLTNRSPWQPVTSHYSIDSR